ncbi:MAG: radical SAM protein [bacterium]|nr:radical SAM protein [bacterium]
MKLRVFNILKSTKVEGPGNRYCIWVQGCSRRCKGCQAVHTWSHKGGILYEVKDIIEDIKSHPDIEGVTFLGGEPFEQAEALGIIAKECHNADLGVVCFTGGLLEDLRKEPMNNMLLNHTDLLIDGEFIIEKTDYSRPWCGSSNQRYHFLTNRYDESIFEKYKNKIEVNISRNGLVFMNGMGDFDLISKKIELKNISM